VSAKNLFFPEGYVSRDKPTYFVDAQPNPEIVWQPRVYGFVVSLARLTGSKMIVDVGCGHCGKLSELMGEFDTVGIDFGENIAFCMKQFPERRWINFDLETPALIDFSSAPVSGATVVCSDVIEHLVDPRPMLANIKALMQSAAVAVFSTPDRCRTYGHEHGGPPENACHVREWNTKELTALLADSGLDIVGSWITQSVNCWAKEATVVAVCVGSTCPPAARKQIGGLALRELRTVVEEVKDT